MGSTGFRKCLISKSEQILKKLMVLMISCITIFISSDSFEIRAFVDYIIFSKSVKKVEKF